MTFEFGAHAIDTDKRQSLTLHKRAMRNHWALSDEQMADIIDQTAEVAQVCRDAGDHRNFTGAVKLLMMAKKMQQERELAERPKEVQHTGRVVLALPDNGRENTGLPMADEPIVIDALEADGTQRNGDGIPEGERSLPVGQSYVV
jgi:hypothetical protein